jgi:hypothetical protein
MIVVVVQIVWMELFIHWALSLRPLYILDLANFFSHLFVVIEKSLFYSYIFMLTPIVRKLQEFT